MTQYGQYNAKNPENPSDLFVFQEVPLSSTKLNRWNGNIAANFDLLHAVLSTLFTRETPALISNGGDSTLRVVAADPPAMAVRIHPGWAVMSGVLAGLGETATLPAGVTIPSPQDHPRIDLVTLSSSGELDIVNGNESAEPIPPAVSADSMALAHIYHRVGSTQITNTDTGMHSYLIDRRPRFLVGEAHHHTEDRAPVEIPDGLRRTFATSTRYQSNALDVFLNGVLQQVGVDYMEDSNRHSYTFIAAPPLSYRIQHRYRADAETI